MDVTEFSLVILKKVREFVQPSIDALAKRIADSEAKLSKTIEERIAQIPAGPQGERGPAGERGERGMDGAPGAAGADGQPGARGETGPAGADGRHGERGEPGERGADGASGPAGPAGERGPAGEPGPADPPRAAGEKGMDGSPGRDGRDGLPGVPGAKGIDGRDGQDGRDGFSLEDLDLTLGEDGRTVTLSFSRGDVKIQRCVRIATLLYRGVYQEGHAYERGDTVTWGGSLWHCEETTIDKPEASKAWKLCVKRGRDGKNGQDAKSLTVVSA